MVKATVKAEWALPPLYSESGSMTGNTGHPPPPLFLIITSVASLGTCAGGGRAFGDLIFFIEKSAGKKIGIAVIRGFKKKFTELEKALKSLIK